VTELEEVCKKCYVTPNWSDEIYHILYREPGKWLCKKCYEKDRNVETQPALPLIGGLFSS